MDFLVRSYMPSDYQQVKKLYEHSELYGGQFDENRDSRERLQSRIENDPDAIFVAERGKEIVGTVSLIEDGRVAWLFRFCVIDGADEVAEALSQKAIEALKRKGHHQVLVYTPTGNKELNSRYDKLGFTKGGDYTCFWKNI